ncbi:IclR family transcriptional regulator C-terminal domain-containing protein [Amycolatopsis rhabdoformis]|uniref:IclR family transcriptional regulator C-terminal domain-containing protein n=1 Tax=Amycolatopsis rhabdoformis TaxID=1448059 RepID=A0ABZ1IAF2_9PSEU|nr:IclR family transcriptional regulator C-terminal domain-containing protein [Amycolatopsis rhabdoformis]WSE31400.1 IclR family transcriptional regulator C-terminal domain-containing protein [Amycolatopsis rhabdoformis]
MSGQGVSGPDVAGSVVAAAEPRFRALGMTGRVFAVLEAVIERQDGDTGVRELAAHLDVSRSAVHRILQTLGDLRVVRGQPSGRYDPGPRLLAWAKFLGERNVLLTRGHDELVALEREAGETAMLLTYSAGDEVASVVSSVECGKPVRYTVRIGSKSPLYAGSAGKAILANLPDEFLTTLDRPTLTGATIGDVDELRAELEHVREQGFATSVAERIPEAAGAAAAYFRDGEPAGAVNITVPRHRLSDVDGLRRLGVLVQGAADRITAALAVPAQVPRVPAAGTGETPGVSAERRSIVRVAAALDALARSAADGLSVDDLTAGISSGRATAARLLAALAELGLARPIGGDRYEAGAELLVWAARLGRGTGIGPVAADVLADLVRDVGESAYLARYDPVAEGVVFEAGRTSDKPIQYVIPLGSTAPLHAGAAGKAVLAWRGPESLAAQDFERFSPTTMVERTTLEADLALIRERGYAVSTGERIPEASGIAAPFFSDGEVAGALTITIPHYRFDPARTPDYAARAVAAAAELTRLLSAGTLFA